MLKSSLDMGEKLVLVDIDRTLTDTAGALRRYAHESSSGRIGREVKQRFYNDPEVLLSLTIENRERIALEHLIRAGYLLGIFSLREANAAQVTEAWLKKEAVFDVFKGGVHLFSLESGVQQKVKFAAQSKASAIFDDSVDVIEEAGKYHLKAWQVIYGQVKTDQDLYGCVNQFLNS